MFPPTVASRWSRPIHVEYQMTPHPVDTVDAQLLNRASGNCRTPRADRGACMSLCRTGNAGTAVATLAEWYRTVQYPSGVGPPTGSPSPRHWAAGRSRSSNCETASRARDGPASLSVEQFADKRYRRKRAAKTGGSQIRNRRSDRPSTVSRYQHMHTDTPARPSICTDSDQTPSEPGRSR